MRVRARLSSNRATPSIGFRQHALTGVTYAHVGNAWLSIADQETLLPP
jgi:hypothetical protein